jgi:hypothetical protein
MQRTLLLTLLLTCGVCSTYERSGPFGCTKQPTCPPPPPEVSYKPLTSPENALYNLISSYRRREIEKYTEFLHKEFIFRFQDGDAPSGLGREFWTHDEDSTGTAALFNSLEVTDIFIDLTYRNAEPATEVDLVGTMKIRVTPMKLAVDDVTGTTYLAEGDIQDLFFERGEAADSTNWYLIEWRDLPGGGGIGKAVAEPLIPTVEKTTWGKLKQRF